MKGQHHVTVSSDAVLVFNVLYCFLFSAGMQFEAGVFTFAKQTT